MEYLRFDDDWHEERTLEDGTRLKLRLLTPADRERVAAAFTALSPQSRYLRCLRPRNELSPSELHFMTDCDGQDHLAIAVLAVDERGREGASVGLARFVRCLDDPEAAEIAITVMDEWQGRGIGSLLLRRLLAAMGERGYREARGVMHPDNTAMRRLVDETGPDARRENEDGLIRFALPVPARRPWPLRLPEDAGRALGRMLRIACAGAVTLPRSYPLAMAERVLDEWRPHAEALIDRLGQLTGGDDRKAADSGD
jgi:RimJ/RimL family protein N-acetyltransferase